MRMFACSNKIPYSGEAIGGHSDTLSLAAKPCPRTSDLWSQAPNLLFLNLRKDRDCVKKLFSANKAEMKKRLFSRHQDRMRRPLHRNDQVLSKDLRDDILISKWDCIKLGILPKDFPKPQHGHCQCEQLNWARKPLEEVASKSPLPSVQKRSKLMQFPLITQQKKNKSRRKKLRNRLLVEFQDIIQDTLLENKQLGGLLMHIQLNDGPIKTIPQWEIL